MKLVIYKSNENAFRPMGDFIFKNGKVNLKMKGQMLVEYSKIKYLGKTFLPSDGEKYLKALIVKYHDASLVGLVLEDTDTWAPEVLVKGTDIPACNAIVKEWKKELYNGK